MIRTLCLIALWALSLVAGAAQPLLSPEELKGLLELCAQKQIARGYVVTKSLDDFGPAQGLPPTGDANADIMRIPAPLLCYWTGAAESSSSSDPASIS